MKLKLKGGGIVDPDSGLDHKAHVLKVRLEFSPQFIWPSVQLHQFKISLSTQILITILQRKETIYSVVLGAVSIQDDKNSYYKLQVLEHDKKPKVD